MSVLISLLRAVVFIIVLLVILIVGWNEPLRYRFMSRADILLVENPPRRDSHACAGPVAVAPATHTPKPVSWMWDPNRGNPLDQGAYHGQRSIYDSGAYPYRPPTTPYYSGS